MDGGSLEEKMTNRTENEGRALWEGDTSVSSVREDKSVADFGKVEKLGALQEGEVVVLSERGQKICRGLQRGNSRNLWGDEQGRGGDSREGQGGQTGD